MDLCLIYLYLLLRLQQETGREERTYRRKTFNFVWIHTILRLDWSNLSFSFFFFLLWFSQLRSKKNDSLKHRRSRCKRLATRTRVVFCYSQLIFCYFTFFFHKICVSLCTHSTVVGLILFQFWGYDLLCYSFCWFSRSDKGCIVACLVHRAWNMKNSGFQEG